MPIYDVECESCGKQKELLTLSFDEVLPICTCGGDYKILPSRISWRWTKDEGVWETDETGQYKYKGKGGKQVQIGGERLDVHSGMPEMAEEEKQMGGKPDLDDDFLTEMPDE